MRRHLEHRLLRVVAPAAERAGEIERVAKAGPGVVSLQMAANFYQPEETETYHPR